MTKTLQPKKQYLLLLAILAINGIFAQTIRYVNASVSGGANNGTTWANAYKDLQPAFAAAQAGDQIWVAKGTYYPTTSTTDRTASFVMKNNVAIYGGFVGGETFLSQRDWTNNVTTLSGDIDYATDPLVITGSGSTLSITGNAGNSYNVVNNNNIGPINTAINITAVLDGLFITGGNANSGVTTIGGGMFNYSSSPTLANLVFTGNNASSGGGGGLANFNSSSPNLINCTFLKNSAPTGAGIFNFNSSPNLNNCIFSGNNAVVGSGNSGGGMANSSSSPNLTNCIFSGNNAGTGGGVSNNGGSQSFTNCIFSGNTATVSSAGGGGGMFNNSSSTSIVNCSIFGNTALIGGGIFSLASSATLKNSIIWGNAPSGIVGGTPIVNYSDIQGGYAGTGNINQDPQFVDKTNPAGADGIFGTADDGLALQTASPCINTGNNAAIPTGATTDIVGLPRIMGGTVDMGAYESPGSILPLTLTSFTAIKVATDAQLAWATATEQNTAGFDIERSTDGSNYLQIGKVRAAGNSNSTISYKFLDANPANGDNYYRLKMMDNDGSFTYSSIRLLNFSGSASVLVYPSPATDYVNVSGVDVGSVINIMALDGRRLLTQHAADNTQKVKLGNLTSGMYLLQAVKNGVVIISTKFIKQ